MAPRGERKRSGSAEVTTEAIARAHLRKGSGLGAKEVNEGNWCGGRADFYPTRTTPGWGLWVGMETAGGRCGPAP